MRLTEVLFKKVKSKRIMVLMESVVSGHQFNTFRDRLADKIELIKFDPYSKLMHFISIKVSSYFPLLYFAVQKESLYRERKRIRSA
ncbi:hypothetical protein KR215_009564 [Drosophila sulfurigaster]|nr:hypothetical protein KR215_009564 [Drosophila sulfurigaster]